MATVVIVDDNLDSCRFLERLLHLEGHMAVCLPAAEAGVEAIRSIKPDLILLDVMLPGMSGIDLLRLLRHDPDLQRLPVVMLSGNMDIEVQSEAFELGALDYIVKGMDWEVAMGRIQQYLPKN